MAQHNNANNQLPQGIQRNHVRTRTLSNGMNVHHYPKKGGELASVSVWINTGSGNETPHNNGIAHFLEHMLFKGTKHFAPKELDLFTEQKGGLMNAATSKDYTYYYITLPAYNLEDAILVLSEMVFNALFIEEEMEREKLVVLQEIKRMQTAPTHDIWHTMYNELFPETPYSMEIIGTATNVRRFTSQDLRDFYHSFYQPKNMHLVIVGDILEPTLDSLVERYFDPSVAPPHHGCSPLFSAYNPSTTEVAHLHANTHGKHITITKDVVNDYGLIAMKTAGNLDSNGFIMQELLGAILSHGETSFLSEYFRDELQVVNVYNTVDISHRHTGVFGLYFVAPQGNSQKVLDLTATVFSEHPYLTQKELDAAKNKLIASYMFDMENTSNIGELIGYIHTSNQSFYWNYIANVESITLSQLKSYTETLFAQNQLTITMGSNTADTNMTPT